MKFVLLAFLVAFSTARANQGQSVELRPLLYSAPEKLEVVLTDGLAKLKFSDVMFVHYIEVAYLRQLRDLYFDISLTYGNIEKYISIERTRYSVAGCGIVGALAERLMTNSGRLWAVVGWGPGGETGAIEYNLDLDLSFNSSIRTEIFDACEDGPVQNLRKMASWEDVVEAYARTLSEEKSSRLKELLQKL